MTDITKLREWVELKRLALAVTNAGLVDDYKRRQTCYEELKGFILALSDRFGEDAALMETLADYTNTFSEAKKFYESAIALHERSGTNAVSAKLDLAHLLLQEGSAKSDVAALIATIDEAELEPDERSDLQCIRELLRKS
jgi:hypothetical protein